VFCVDLRTNSDYFPIQHWLTGFYNLDAVCLLDGSKQWTINRQTATGDLVKPRRYQYPLLPIPRTHVSPPPH
jgi:hypothetical protein